MRGGRNDQARGYVHVGKRIVNSFYRWRRIFAGDRRGLNSEGDDVGSLEPATKASSQQNSGEKYSGQEEMSGIFGG